MKKKALLLFPIAIGLIYVGYGLLGLSRGPGGYNTATSSNLVGQEENRVDTEVVAHSSTSVQVLADKGQKRTVTERAVVSDWMERAGLSPRDLEVYYHYSDQQLSDLADGGDTNAMHVLGIRKLSSEGIKAAIPFAQKEIIYGSLRGISTMANYVEPDMSSNFPIDEVKRELMESLAYRRLYSMRANIFSPKAAEETAIDTFKMYYKVEKVFTDDDEAWMNNRAKDLYDYYQAERNKLGLGDFDNELPKEVEDFLK
jgi:hypothetical protein